VYNHRGFLWDRGSIWDLGSLIPAGSGWDYLEIGQEINEAGQIVGWGVIGGQRHAFLMSPAPIPEPCTVLLFGAGLLALVRRRRKP